jgi:DNA-binding HxlR family transcriptional regulator
LIRGLYRRRWADLALATLAGAQGPYRQADLKLALVARSGIFVHHRAFSNAMSYLEANHLVVRRNEKPGVVLYEIADLGRVLHAQLLAVEHSVHERHTDDDAQQSTARCHPRPEQ